MITYSDSETSTDAVSVISLPPSEDFEIILMPVASPSAGTASGCDSLAESIALLGLDPNRPEESRVDATLPRAQGPSATKASASAVWSPRCRGSDGSSSESQVASSPPAHRPSVKATHTPSILSASDARESVDSFLTDPEFTSDKSNKLRLWQALCIELGLVELEESDDSWLKSLSLRKDSEALVKVTLSDEDSGCTPTASRSATPTPAIASLPTSLTAANRLLSTRGHVNILEYLEARGDPNRHTEDVVGKYADLVYPSASSLQRNMRRQRKYAKIDNVKREWLQPLLKDFGFRRRRQSHT
ncbi:hypothetical protein CspeluHIS016_0301560 [Cutaneotrichosporon spelunceum]|uniref:Uncharacterized protein n=1 Tax=Cutaneotrichosporon spelunceum TaxID=1672016 RepID=A0AAD3YAT5_9TREE|nr:hypothetical protein CspeluHIS016_0301560 [Cutaneotrichosporon spelunceum]